MKYLATYIPPVGAGSNATTTFTAHPRPNYTEPHGELTLIANQEVEAPKWLVDIVYLTKRWADNAGSIRIREVS
jgi:hypothetical protein